MEPIRVELPLQGVWQVVTSPADHIPSHYTTRFGMSHAYDFAKTDDANRTFFSKLKTVPVEECQGWGEPLFCPCNGQIVATHSDAKDRSSLNFFRDTISGIRTLFFNPTRRDYDVVFGNYIVIQGSNYYCLLAHLKEKSIQVAVGDRVSSGDKLAEIGHSGSSQAPHLHMQLMDQADLSVAEGLPMSFDLMMGAENGEWKRVDNHIPARGAQIQRINQ